MVIFSQKLECMRLGARDGREKEHNRLIRFKNIILSNVILSIGLMETELVI